MIIIELVVVMYKDKWKKSSKGKSDTAKDEFVKWTNGMWNFSGESKKKIGHPAPFPVELPKRCIKLFSYVGDIVLNLFMENEKMTVASKTHGNKSISKEFCKIVGD